MVIYDFLKKYQEELISDRIDLKEKLDFINTKLTEERKFLSILEGTNDSYFSEFSPRTLNAANNEKAEEVRNTISSLENDFKIYSEKMKFFDFRIGELNSILDDYITVSYSEVSEKQNIVSNYNDDLDTNISETENISGDFESIKSKLIDIKKLVLLDPYRASLEIDSLINNI